MTTSLLDFLSTSEPVGNVWNYISASRLSLWMKCPLAFRRRYVDGIESAPSVSMFVGKVVHGVLEHVYRCRSVGAIASEDDLPAFVEAAWSRSMEEEPCFFDDVEQEKKCRSQIHDLAKSYLSEINIAEETPVAIEKRFEVPLVDPSTGEDLGLPLMGIVDLVLEMEKELTIVDFKTAASASSTCEIQHEIQLTAYSYLVRQLLDRDESALEIRQLIKTKQPKIVVHRFTPRSDAHFKRFFGIVREYLDSLDRGVFNYRPGFGCIMCNQVGDCCS